MKGHADITAKLFLKEKEIIMSNLSAGFSRIDITPMRGIGISGYYISRLAEGVLDNLYARALALSYGEKRMVILGLDILQIQTPVCNRLREEVATATGLPMDAIFIHCTHTHTGPYVDTILAQNAGLELDVEPVEEYQRFLSHRLADVACEALEDLSPARMGFAIGHASNVAYIRRFRMKDGSVRTNPGVNNPDILAPIGELDERVSVLRFDREGKKSITLMNYANHPDVVGGNKISADWPGLSCVALEKAIDTTEAIFINGMQGDVNHVNVHPTKGFLNDLFMDFDDVARGYGHAKYMARVMAGAVMQVWDKVEYVDVDGIDFINRTVNIPSNKPAPEEMPEARRINDLHTAGRDAELPYEGMMLTTVVADAARKVRLENAPDFFPMIFSALRIGNVALIGVPGEPFNGIGRALKKAEGWDLVIPCCLTNGSEGYFPMEDAYAEGGYEAKSSNFKAGVAEKIIAEGHDILAGFRK